MDKVGDGETTATEAVYGNEARDQLNWEEITWKLAMMPRVTDDTWNFLLWRMQVETLSEQIVPGAKEVKDEVCVLEMGRTGENALRHTVRVVKLSCSRSQATRRRYISFLQVLCGHSSNFYLLVLCFGCVESLFEFLSKCVYGDSSPLAVLSNISHFCLKEGITSTSDGCLVPASDVFNARISRIWCGGEHSCPSFPLCSNQ